MATGFGLSNKGKANSAGEELQDIDWDSIPADKRGTDRCIFFPKIFAQN